MLTNSPRFAFVGAYYTNVHLDKLRPTHPLKLRVPAIIAVVLTAGLKCTSSISSMNTDRDLPVQSSDAAI